VRRCCSGSGAAARAAGRCRVLGTVLLAAACAVDGGTRPPQQPQQPQEPARHIDDVLPPARAPRPLAEATAAVGFGFGRLDVRIGGTRLDGDDHSVTWFATVEAGEATTLGPGVRLELLRSGDGLFEGELMNDGFTVRPADARADSFDCNPYLVWRPEANGDLATPVRFGAFVDTLRLQHQHTEVRRDWAGYGVRAECAPEWTFADDGDTRWQLCGLLGADFGGARFRENFVGGRDEDSVLRWMGEVGIGVRIDSGGLTGQLDYRLRAIQYGETDTALLGADRDTTVIGNQLLLQVGVRF